MVPLLNLQEMGNAATDNAVAMSLMAPMRRTMLRELLTYLGTVNALRSPLPAAERYVYVLYLHLGTQTRVGTYL